MTNNNTIISEHNENIAHIRLNRPDLFNAVNSDLCSALRQAIIDAEQDDSVKAVLISANGRAFCAGGDLNSIKQLCNTDADELHATLTKDFAAVQQIYRCTKPTVSAVHGVVVGGGVGISVACDFVVADTDTKFAFPFLDLGIIPDMGILHLLTHRVGLAHARRLLLRGVSVKAAEALQINLVDEVSESGQAFNDALSLARALAKRGGPAMNFAKQHLNQVCQYSFEESLKKEIRRQTLLWTTPDVRERTNTMLQKLARKKT